MIDSPKTYSKHFYPLIKCLGHVNVPLSMRARLLNSLSMMYYPVSCLKASEMFLASDHLFDLMLSWFFISVFMSPVILVVDYTVFVRKDHLTFK